jgi:hypothetical protein
MPSTFDQLSAHLNSQDPDAMEWADGLGNEIARDLLSGLCVDDWGDLSNSWQMKSRNWRICLAEILYPKDMAASKLLLDMTEDPDLGVAFAALRVVSFYCGINDGDGGPFLDERICNPQFLALAVARPSLLSQLERAGAQCGDRFRGQFELLASRLLRSGQTQ